MKNHYQLSFLLILVIALFSFSCKDSESDRIRDQARQTLPPAPSSNVATSPSAAPAFPTFNSVPHYKCPNNCSGGIGDTAGNCPVCGTQMAHNQAYHDQSNTPTAPQTTTVQPQNATPAQNAAGVYHYTCPSGCAGGAATAGVCGTCGATLAHNAAYHGN